VKVRVALILAACLTPACVQRARPANAVLLPVRVTSTESIVRRGDSINWILTNGTDTMLGYNGCPQMLEIWRRARWQRVYELPSEPLPSDGIQRDCAAIRLSLNAGSSTQLRTDIPPTTPTGTYRLVFLWIPTDPRRRDSDRLVSPIFKVR